MAPTLVQQAAEAALEILNGEADVLRVLELGNHIAVAKHLLHRVAAGELMFAPTPAQGSPAAQEISSAVPLAVALGMLDDRD